MYVQVVNLLQFLFCCLFYSMRNKGNPVMWGRFFNFLHNVSQINVGQTFVGNFAIKLRDSYKENTLKTHFLAQNHTVNLCCNRDSKITDKRTQKVLWKFFYCTGVTHCAHWCHSKSLYCGHLLFAHKHQQECDFPADCSQCSTTEMIQK